MQTMTIADFLMHKLAAAGARHVFLIPGGGCMHLVDSLGRNEQLEPVAMLHEQGVGVAAEAYAQYTDGIGVALVTTGPGGTNVLTAVAAAWLDSTPLVVISGQVKTADLVGSRGVRQFGFQEIDICAMAKPITKAAITISDPAMAVDQIIETIEIAVSGRPGPVVIDIPLDIQATEISVSPEELSAPVGKTIGTQSPLDLEELLTRLNEANRPVLLIGNGVRLAKATKALVEFAERAKIPCLFTWKAFDMLPFNHELNAGRPGAVASRYANFAQQGSDLFISIGARLDLGQTGYRPENLAPNAHRVVVDIDENEILKLKQEDIESWPVDAGNFLNSLNEQSKAFTWTGYKPWHEAISKWKSEFPIDLKPGKQPMETYEVLKELSDFMAPDDIFVPGSSGACSEVSMQAFENKKGQRVLNSEGLGPMGFGIPAPIGVSCAAPSNRIFSIDGDGGFQMNIQELEVAKRRNAKICWMVLDNDGYGSIKVTQDGYFNGRRVASDTKSGLSLPNAAKVAEAYGLNSVVVTNADELRIALNQFAKKPSPTVIVAKVNPDHRTEPRIASVRNEDGTMTSDALENLTPKLPAEALEAHLTFD
jgi:acetolactate synthase-1/2/3 large subunit